jgi:hypothetical protein
MRPVLLGVLMEAEFEELVRSSRGMPSANEASEVREFVEARQCALALEAMCGILLDENKHVTPELYSTIHGLIELTDGVDPFVIDSLRAAVLWRQAMSTITFLISV